jgi:hypothetical protein
MRNAKQYYVLTTNRGTYNCVIKDIAFTEYKRYYTATIIVKLYTQLMFPSFEFYRLRDSVETDITSHILHAELEREAAQASAIAIVEISNPDDINAQILKVGDEIKFKAGYDDLNTLRGIFRVNSIQSLGSKEGERKRVICKLASAFLLYNTKQIAEKIWTNASNVYTVITDANGLLKDTGLSSAGVSTDLTSRNLNGDFVFYAGERKDEIAYRLTQQLKTDLGENWLFWCDKTTDTFYFQRDNAPSEVYDHSYVWGEDIISKDLLGQEGELKNWILGYGQTLDTTHDTQSYELIHNEAGLTFEPHSICQAGDVVFGVGAESGEGIIFKIQDNIYTEVFSDSNHSKYYCVYPYGANYLLIGHETGIAVIDTRTFTLAGFERITTSTNQQAYVGVEDNYQIVLDNNDMAHCVWRRYNDDWVYSNKISGDWQSYAQVDLGGYPNMCLETGENKIWFVGTRKLGTEEKLQICSKFPTDSYFSVFALIDSQTSGDYSVGANYRPITRIVVDASQFHRVNVLEKVFTAGVPQKMYFHYWDGNAWSEENFSSYYWADMCIAIGSETGWGNIHLIAAKAASIIYRVRFAESWGSEKTIDSGAGTWEDALVAIADDSSQSRIHAAYIVSGTLKYAYSDNGGTTWTKQTVDTGLGSTWQTTEMVLKVNSLGLPFIAYRESEADNLIIYHTDGVSTWQSQIVETPDNSSSSGARFDIDSEDILNIHLARYYYDETAPGIWQWVLSPTFLKWKEAALTEVLDTSSDPVIDISHYSNQYVAITQGGVNVVVYFSENPRTSWTQVTASPGPTGKGIETDENSYAYACLSDHVDYAPMPLTAASTWTQLFTNSPNGVTTIKKIGNVLYTLGDDGDLFSWTDKDYLKTETNTEHGMGTVTLEAIGSVMNYIFCAYGATANVIRKQTLLPTSEIWGTEKTLATAVDVKEMHYIGEDSIIILQNGKVTLGTPVTPVGVLNIARVARDLTSINTNGKLWDIAMDTSQDTVKEVDTWLIALLLKLNQEKRGGQIIVPLQQSLTINDIVNLQAGNDSGFFSLQRIRDEIKPALGTAITIMDIGWSKPSYKEVFRDAVQDFTQEGTQKAAYNMKGRLDMETYTVYYEVPIDTLQYLLEPISGSYLGFYHSAAWDYFRFSEDVVIYNTAADIGLLIYEHSGGYIVKHYLTLVGSDYTYIIEKAPASSVIDIKINAGSGTLTLADASGSKTLAELGGYVEGARVYNSLFQTIATATWTAITFDSERYDTDSIHSTVSNTSRLTCQTDGKYIISGNVAWVAQATGDRRLEIYLNGSTTIAREGGNVPGGSAFVQSITTIYNLSATDYVELRVLQTTGGNLNVLAIGNYSPEFSIQRIG